MAKNRLRRPIESLLNIFFGVTCPILLVFVNLSAIMWTIFPSSFEVKSGFEPTSEDHGLDHEFTMFTTRPGASLRPIETIFIIAREVTQRNAGVKNMLNDQKISFPFKLSNKSNFGRLFLKVLLACNFCCLNYVVFIMSLPQKIQLNFLYLCCNKRQLNIWIRGHSNNM